MIKKYFLLFILFLGLENVQSQISTGGFPPSFEASAILRSTFKEIHTIHLSTIDLQNIYKEDSIEDNIKEIPRRFGIARDVSLNLENAGTWENLPNGDRMWRLKINSPGALSININYDKFYIPSGAELYLYSNKKSLIGAFTSLNNKLDSSFATRPTEGDEVTLEYYEPSNIVGQSIIQIKHVVHGYRSIFENLKAFGSSGACNVNINCLEGAKWQDVKRSVAMVLANNNTRKCSGTLLNNVRQDSIPYFLTAGHCGPVSNSIFIFNYESPLCQPTLDGKLTHSITGSIARSTNTPSDFNLVELSVTPPDSFRVFYAGWSAIDTPSLSSTTIHHPSGDVKKISFDFDPVISSSYVGVIPNTHWQVINWDIGTTESNSSGSGLFNQYQRLVGQLQGGIANCGNDASDWFGKFSYSWQSDPDSNQQLKYWLNPDNVPILVLNGMDTDSADSDLDAEVLFVNGLPIFSCDTNLTPIISIRNLGNDTIHSLNVHYSINNGPVTVINWTGSLPRFEIEEIILGNIAFPNGSTAFTAFSSNPNGLLDQYTSNDTLIYNTQTTSEPTYIRFELKTDDFGEETTWKIEDRSSNKILYRGGPYPNITGGQVYIDTLCLYDTCFDYTIFDEESDGINGMWGNGYYLITDMKGDTLVYNNNFTGSSQSHIFCLDYLNSINKYPNHNYKISIYPNPVSDGRFSIATDINIKSIKVYNLQGKLMQEWNDYTSSPTLELKSCISSGMYILSIEEKNGNIYSQKLLVK